MNPSPSSERDVAPRSKDRALIVGGRLVALVTFVLGAVAMGIVLLDGSFDAASTGFYQTWSGTLIIPIVVLLAIPKVPRNGSLWGFAAVGLSLGLSVLGDALVISGLGFSSLAGESVRMAQAPADLPVVDAVGLMLTQTFWVPGFVLMPTFVLLLFPDGRYPEPRRWWRWIGILTVALSTVAIIALLWSYWPTSTTSYEELSGQAVEGSASTAEWMGALVGFTTMGFILLVIASIIGYVVKWRRASGEARLQYRWVGLALLVYALESIVEVLLGSVMPEPVGALLSWFGIALIAVAYAIAILKYRLYDIDVVVSRSITYAFIAVFITAVYSVVVVAVGSLVDAPSTWFEILAIGLVALAFEPVRLRAQRIANRLVYGQRATPYEVLSDLSSRLAEAEHEAGLLDRMAAQLAAGTGAERARVWLADGSTYVLAGAYPEESHALAADLADVPGIAVPIEHAGGTLGALTVEPRTGTHLSPAERRLAQDLAGSASLVIRKLRLDEQLERTAQELASSRRRLVDAQDAELRRLERELQEGAQQNVVGLKVRIALAARTAAQEGSDRSAQLLATVVDDAQAAIDEIRSLATGIYPALLESDGLGAAIRGIAANAPVPVTVEGAPTRHPIEIETAAYYCISEALTNAMKYGRAPVVVTLTDTGGSLRFAVRDSGPGFDIAAAKLGSGIANMRDRADTLGGSVVIESSVGSPTVVRGSIPLGQEDQPVAATSASGPKSDLETNATAPASSAGAS